MVETKTSMDLKLKKVGCDLIDWNLQYMQTYIKKTGSKGAPIIPKEFSYENEMRRFRIDIPSLCGLDDYEDGRVFSKWLNVFVEYENDFFEIVWTRSPRKLYVLNEKQDLFAEVGNYELYLLKTQRTTSHSFIEEIYYPLSEREKNYWISNHALNLFLTVDINEIKLDGNPHQLKFNLLFQKLISLSAFEWFEVREKKEQIEKKLLEIKQLFL